MATPHVVGAAALYLQTNPGATPAMVETALEGNATTNRVISAGTGSPNLLLYTGFINLGPPPSPPAAPTNLSATAIDYQRIDLAWTDNATDETSYEVQRSTGGGAFTTVATLAANSISYSNTGLSGSTSYTYQVLARNAGGSSASNTATATTAASPLDTPPVARYTWSCTGHRGRTCYFNGTSSTDDKGITSYAWVFGDGWGANGAAPAHRYNSSGTFQVRLTVADAASQSNSRTCAVRTGTTGTCAP
jgi:hypothetical protein